MSGAQRRRVLSVVATDSTFSRAQLGGRDVWAGKCLHCNAHLAVELDGAPLGRVTVEHIRPRSHGGTDDSENLGLACARCNHQKGVRHDNRRKGDATLEAYVEALLVRRRARWRDAEPPLRSPRAWEPTRKRR